MRILLGTMAALALCFVLAGCGSHSDTTTAEAPAPRADAIDRVDDELAPSTEETADAAAVNSPATGAGNSTVDPHEPPPVEEEPVATGPRPSLWIEMITAPLGDLMTNAAASLQQGMGQRRPASNQQNGQDEPEAEIELPAGDPAP